MLGAASSFYGMSLTQVTKLFAVVHSSAGQFSSRTRATPPLAPAASDNGKSPFSAPRNVTSDALLAIHALTHEDNPPTTQPPAPPAARYDALAGMFANADGATPMLATTIEGAAEGSSYSFSFSANQRFDPSTGRATGTFYSFYLEVNGHFVMSGWVNGGRDPSTDPVQITVGFSYAEGAASASTGSGGTAVEEGAYRAIAGQFTIDTGAFARSLPVRYGSGTQSRLLQSTAQGSDIRISSGVKMASGGFEKVSTTAPAAPAANTMAAESFVSLRTSFSVIWGA